MSLNLPSHFTSQFSTNVNLLLQQKGSKLRDCVVSGSHAGKQASPVNQIGQVNAQRVIGRFGSMGRVDAPVDRRWVFPTDYDLPQQVDKFDEIKLIEDPKSALVQNAVLAMGRAIDDEIISAFFGTSKTGETGSTSTTFPAGQVVAVNEGSSGNGGLSVAKLRAAKKLLMAAEVDLDSDPIYCAITAKQHDDLLKEATVISMDFNSKPVLVDGKMNSFMGFNFVHCERLALNSTPYRLVPVWAKSGMYLGMWSDIQTSISQRHDLQSEPWQAYCIGSFGATRLEELKTVQILCNEA